MPVARFEMPDGRIARFEVPDGTTPEQAEAMIAEAMPQTTVPSKMDSFVKGLRDPIDGGAQLLTKMLPEGVVNAGNRVNNFIADKTGLVGRLPEGGVDQQVREQEQAYQSARSPNAGFDWMRLAGNAVSPANVAMGASMPAAATLTGRMALGAGAGAVGGALTPVTSDDFAGEKLKQIGMGAGGGAAVSALGSAAARMVSPNASTSQQIAALRAEGVRPTVGQTLGGFANRVEEKMTSLPVVGDAIVHARQGAAADLNRAAFNRALAPIGQQLPQGLTGREAVQYVDDAISAGYNQLLPNLTARADQQFNGAIRNLRQMVRTGAIDPRAAQSFERILQNDVLVKFGGRQAMTGETLKRVESDIGQQIARLGASTDADQRLVADALRQVQDEFRQLITRSNPNQAQELQALNTAWANFKRVQKAAGSLGAEDGVFSPAQLQSAVKAADRSKDKGRFATGGALMQDLSDAGKTVLGSKVPDSGTPGRLFVSGGAAGASLLDPTMTAPIMLGGGALLYSPPAQALLRGLIASRPQAAQPVANALRQASPGLGLLGGQVATGLLNY